MNTDITAAFLKGFFVAAPLIIAIGAQNAFVLRQGLLKQYVFYVCLICAFFDTVFISLGVFGVGNWVGQNITAQLLLAGAGALFLMWYGVGALRRAFQPQSMNVNGQGDSASFKKVVLSTLAITLLNPHVYLDTVVLIGGVSSTVPSQFKLYFLIGASCASFVWFFSLGYGARLLTPLFKKEMTWKVLDAVISVVIFVIALSLVKFIYEKTGF